MKITELNKYKLKKPIELDGISRTGYRVSNSEFPCGGYGDTVEEAIEDFKREIEGNYLYYKNRKEKDCERDKYEIEEQEFYFEYVEER